MRQRTGARLTVSSKLPVSCTCSVFCRSLCDAQLSEPLLSVPSDSLDDEPWPSTLEEPEEEEPEDEDVSCSEWASLDLEELLAGRSSAWLFLTAGRLAPLAWEAARLPLSPALAGRSVPMALLALLEVSEPRLSSEGAAAENVSSELVESTGGWARRAMRMETDRTRHYGRTVNGETKTAVNRKS